MRRTQRSIQQGMGMVEVLVVVGFLGVSILALGGLATQGIRLLRVAADRQEAVLYAREGIEAVKGIRNLGWDEHIAVVTVDTPYYLVQTNGRWELTTVDPGALYGRPQNFTREVLFERVFRDGSDNIVPVSPDEDPHTRRVIVTVSWTSAGGNRSFEAVTYLTNIFAN